MPRYFAASILVSWLSIASALDQVKITPEEGIQGKFTEAYLAKLVAKNTNWDDSMRPVETRPQLDALEAPPKYFFGYEHDLFDGFLKTNNEPQRLKFWNKWGYVSKFIYDDAGYLRLIEHYTPLSKTRWSTCDGFLYKEGKLSEQFLFEQWPQNNNNWSFRRNRYVFSYEKNSTTIEYFMGGNTKWAKEERFYNANHLLARVTERLTDRKIGITIEFLYNDDGLIKERRVDWEFGKEFGNPEDSSVTHYQYNMKHQLTLASDSKNKDREEWEYLADGSIKSSFYSPRFESGAPQITISRLNKFGFPSAITFGNGSDWTFVYEGNPNYKP